MTIQVDEAQELCDMGWTTKGDPCNYTGGCYCNRPKYHRGRCVCICGGWHLFSDRDFDAMVKEYDL